MDYSLTRAGERCWPVGSSHVSLGASQAIPPAFGNVLIVETSRKKKQLKEAKFSLRCEDTAHKRKHLSEKELKKRESVHFLSYSRHCLFLMHARPCKAEAINRPVCEIGATRSLVRKTHACNSRGQRHAGGGRNLRRRERRVATAGALAAAAAGATAQVL
jgi:hypothetical protein